MNEMNLETGSSLARALADPASIPVESPAAAEHAFGMSSAQITESIVASGTVEAVKKRRTAPVTAPSPVKQLVIGEFDDDGNSWRFYAACKDEDPNLFAGATSEERPATRNARYNVAKAVCAKCVVSEVCLKIAMDPDAPQVGIWGGTSESDRNRLKREATSKLEREAAAKARKNKTT